MSEYYSNRMEVVGNIVSPPTKTIRYIPVKDAYISQYWAVDSFGDRESLQINSSASGSINDILMTFHVPRVSKEILENLLSVNLVIYPHQKLKRDLTLVFKNHLDYGWIENGITYLGQPYTYPETAFEATIPKGSAKIVVDVKDLYLAAIKNDTYYDPAWTISEKGNDNNTTIATYSKEYGQNHSTDATLSVKSPAIEITYEYFPENLASNDFKAQFTTRRNVPNDDELPPDLPGVVNVVDKWEKSSLNGQFTVHTWDVPSDTEPAPDLPGVINIRKWQWGNDNDPEGIVTVRRNIPNKTEPAPDLPAVFGIAKYFVDDGQTDPETYWLIHKPAPYLEAQFTVHTWDVPSDDEPAPDLEAQFTCNLQIPNSDTPAPDLEAQFYTHLYIADGGLNPDDQGRPWVTHMDPGDLECQFNCCHIVDEDVKNGEAAPYLPATFISNPDYYADDGDSLPEHHEPWEIHVPSSNLECQFTCRHNVPNDYEPAPDLEAQFYTHLYIADDGTNPDEEGRVWVTHVPSANLECQFNARNHVGGNKAPYIEGIIGVHSYIADDGTNPDTEQPWVIHIPSYNLSCKFICRQHSSGEDLNCQFAVRTYTEDDGTNPDDKHPWETHYPSSNFDCQFENFIYYADDGTNPDPDNDHHIHEPAPTLDCTFVAAISVPNANEPAPDLDAQFEIYFKVHSYLDAQFTIPERVDLEAEFICRVTRTADLISVFQISKGINLPYCYIM